MSTVNRKNRIEKNKTADGSYPISLRVSKDRKSEYFQTIFRAFPKEWNQTTGASQVRIQIIPKITGCFLNSRIEL
tara:strand:+ start:1017 stop:1241 length:225 start_codon:yes stop_codon:yes gene_type:complete